MGGWEAVVRSERWWRASLSVAVTSAVSSAVLLWRLVSLLVSPSCRQLPSARCSDGECDVFAGVGIDSHAELDDLIALQRSKPIRLQLILMNERIVWRTVRWCNEAVTLCWIKPAHCSCLQR